MMTKTGAELTGSADYSDVPTAVFSQPPVGTVGLTEEQARDKYGDVHIYKTSFRAMKHTLTGRQVSVRVSVSVSVSVRVSVSVSVHRARASAGAPGRVLRCAEWC